MGQVQQLQCWSCSPLPFTGPGTQEEFCFHCPTRRRKMLSIVVRSNHLTSTVMPQGSFKLKPLFQTELQNSSSIALRSKQQTL